MIEACARWDASLSARQLILSLLGLLTVFVALSLLSRDYPMLGMGLAGLLLGGTALFFPRLGLSSLLMVAPIQGLWGISRQDMPLLIGSIMAAINLRHMTAWLSFPRPWQGGAGSTLLVIFAAFIVLYVLRGLLSLPDMPPMQSHMAGREALFLILLLGVSLAVRERCQNTNGDALRLGLLGAIALALGLTLAFDIIAVYFPALSLQLGLLPNWEGLRLAGLHANPNATAKFIIGGLLFAVAASWRFRGLDGEPKADVGRLWLSLAVVGAIGCAISVGATLSKASLLGGMAALGLVAVPFWLARRRRAALVALLSAVCVLGMALGFDAVLALGLAKQTNLRRLQAEKIVIKPPPLAAGAASHQALSLSQKMAQNLRLSQSSEMILASPNESGIPKRHSEIYRNIQGTIEYRPRECGLGCTGQRDRLWKTGLLVLTDHWGLGIGPAAWPSEFQDRLHFPFDTPHNVILELWGGFGLPGLAVYATLVMVMLRIVKQAFGGLPLGSTAATVYTRGAVMFALSIMVSEWFDPAKFFTMNPHALWVWPLLSGIVAGAATAQGGSSHQAPP